ncbi:topoisomerase DNA-binding C4 zinc finger domain-containing protein [Pseudomonas syringae]|nr:topoisomerase DNA-binding C4 zinc finger domain-containing protein [Pseudomonas syringae]MBD8573197.1 topoisomerase DNA-binding C4 zinc finger domain-containing protein [Pseudomonas syringae]MBD8790291.1 topoisomerase DNA-binding C4 zinc finger domain-containing protein [Pseudomonas syringae]MBD8799211.1 topoisomerase DNA-binding C4 zinc finger domain-containing protein [Pseudomonas syringae]MBD8810037.1 topoisomerase DNA-binding C4 zinc finger domain-containing protein [Pseudomonas syringae
MSRKPFFTPAFWLQLVNRLPWRDAPEAAAPDVPPAPAQVPAIEQDLARPRPSRPTARTKAKAKASPAPAKPTAPACPHCKKTMISKVARTGANAGGPFWGCTDYPKCRGIRAIFAPLPSRQG